MSQDKPTGPLGAQHQLDHEIELAKLQQRTDAAVAAARSPGEWFDIWSDIVATGVRQTLELSLPDKDAAIALFDRLMRDQAPFTSRVRRDFEAHGLPLLEEIEYEGPDVANDELGLPHVVSWPRGVWIEFYWPTAGSKGDKLRFEGQAAVCALGFVQWWVGFQQVAMHMAGKDPIAKRRLVEPGSNDYIRYISEKSKERGPT